MAESMESSATTAGSTSRALGGYSLSDLSDDCLVHVLGQLGPQGGAVVARCCQRFAGLFSDDLLWRQFLCDELGLPADVRLDRDARVLYRARGARLG